MDRPGRAGQNRLWAHSGSADPPVDGIFCRVEIRSVVDEVRGFGSKVALVTALPD